MEGNLIYSTSEIKSFYGESFYKSYTYLGSHLTMENGVHGTRFSVWAPNAREVRVVGDFNNWVGDGHVMSKNDDSGIWSLFIPGIGEWVLYKYEITTQDDRRFMKSDPYAFYSELRPNTASKVVNLNKHQWQDKNWMDSRSNTPVYKKPVNIYEVHLGSWQRAEGNGFLDYRNLAHKLADYVCHMGYTHIEILPLTEHPLDDSWGYQATGYYSLTSRFGGPEDFMYFVDLMHQRGIGVILDWVPGHFCKDAHGLYRFDGTPLYEYSDPRLGENYDWGTSNFDLSKLQVQRFLISNAVFWFDTYHIDGLRVDAVANMLYLNYGGRWNLGLKNKYGQDENLDGIEFCRRLNETIFGLFPNVLMIAEDSSSYPKVTGPTWLGGLGFNYKWNMGWMNDMLKLMGTDPLYRKYEHKLITFSFMYSFSENYVLPLSHDEVVHLKKSLISKMPGDYPQQFAGLRLLLGYMMAHPGKKLLFMGGEFGQFAEWNFSKSLDWHLLGYEMHRKIHDYARELNLFYKNENALWELDSNPDGFSWIDHLNHDESVYTFMRSGQRRENFIIAVFNFTPIPRLNYKIGVPVHTNYIEAFSSDWGRFGGSDNSNQGIINSYDEGWHNQPCHMVIKVPPLSLTFFKPQL